MNGSGRMNKSDYYRIWLLGVVCGSCFVTLFYMISVVMSTKDSEIPQSNFEVVDTYNGCDIIKWQDPHYREYKFFLDCSNKKQ